MRKLHNEHNEVPVVTAHELRHTYGTYLRRHGADIYTIQKLLGHKDINVTAEIYVHNEIDTLRNVLTSINPTDEKQAKPPNLPDDKLTTPRCNGLKEITDFPSSILRTIFRISSQKLRKTQINHHFYTSKLHTKVYRFQNNHISFRC